MNQYWLQSGVNLYQPPHSHNTQPIINLIKITSSQHNISSSISYKNVIFRHQIIIKEKRTNLIDPNIEMMKYPLSSDIPKHTEPPTTLLKC